MWCLSTHHQDYCLFGCCKYMWYLSACHLSVMFVSLVIWLLVKHLLFKCWLFQFSLNGHFKIHLRGILITGKWSVLKKNTNIALYHITWVWEPDTVNIAQTESMKSGSFFFGWMSQECIFQNFTIICKFWQTYMRLFI